jgi:DNA-binding MarR family transcriptional regulator
MKEEYLAVIALAERLHRRTLDVLQLELTRLKVADVSAVQAMILLNIGPEEVTAKDLMVRGSYQGSNISYNLKSLTERGYITQTRSETDRRVIIIKLSAKGNRLLKDLNKLFDRLAASLAEHHIDEGMLKQSRTALDKLDQFTNRQSSSIL